MPPNDDGILLPIQVGKALTDTDLHIQADNELNGQPCDNISDKNPTYNELTAMYWAWKNLKKLYPDVKYVGLCHYRRLFAFGEQKFFAHAIPMPEEAVLDYRIDAEKIIRILELGKVIVNKRYAFPYHNAAQYCMSHVSSDYKAVKRIIEEKYPDYYDDFMQFMEHSNKILPGNMFIMKYDDFTKYCEWLFEIMPLIEPEYMKNYSPEQRRLFMSERLMNVYFRKHKIRTKHFNYYYYGEKPDTRNPVRQFLSCINRFLTVSKFNLAMFILNLSFAPFRRLIKKFPLKH